MSEPDIEIWKDIKGYEGTYQVSNHGRIKSLARILPRCGRGARITKESIRNLVDHKESRGYSITLTINKKSKHCLVSRLVAEAFIPNPHGHKRIVHLDGNKKNNHVSNLSYRAARAEYGEESATLEKIFSCLGVTSLGEVLAEVERLKKESDGRI